MYYNTRKVTVLTTCYYHIKHFLYIKELIDLHQITRQILFYCFTLYNALFLVRKSIYKGGEKN